MRFQDGKGASVANEGWDDAEFRSKWQEQADEIGRFNLAIFGKTGVGKSTLINAIFGREVAQTGVGQPVTMDEILHLHDNGFLGLLDTRGLEIGDDSDAIIKDLSAHMKARAKDRSADQVHVAWYCVSASSKRFEEAEADFIRRLDELGLPVIVVLTQVPSRDGKLHGDAIELAEHITQRELPIVGGRPLPVMAQPDDFTGQPSHGLNDLLDATFRVAPEGVRVALTAAQKIDMGRKFRQAQLAVWAAGALAGATSVFLKDEPKALPTIILGMTGSVAAIYGVPEDLAAVAWAAAATAVTAGRGGITDGLIALIAEEKIGTQDVITGVVAGSFVVAVGYGWTAVCAQLAQGKLEGISGVLREGMVRDLFLAQFRKKFTQEAEGAPAAP